MLTVLFPIILTVYSAYIPGGQNMLPIDASMKRFSVVVPGHDHFVLKGAPCTTRASSTPGPISYPQLS